MNFIKKMFKDTVYSGILFENDKVKIIQIKEKGGNFFPIYWSSLDFNLENLLEKQEMISFFKIIKTNIKTDTIKLKIVVDDENKQNEIISNLKIAGFLNISSEDENKNLENLIINKNTIERSIFAFFENAFDLNIFYVKENHIYKKENYKWEDLDDETIKKIFKDIDERHIFISGNFANIFNEIKKRFYENEIKVHIFNIWTNILNFKIKIPDLFKNDSHNYVKLISLTLPSLEKIKFIEEKVEDIKTKKQENTKDIDVDFIMDNKKLEKDEIKKSTVWEKIKNILNLRLFETKRKVNESTNKDKKKKIFLPKPKLKLFLPKIKINKNILKKTKTKEKIETKVKNIDKTKKEEKQVKKNSLIKNWWNKINNYFKTIFKKKQKTEQNSLKFLKKIEIKNFLPKPKKKQDKK